jgi:hypothetical protein
MDTELSYGMVLSYHEEFIIHESLVSWFEDNDIIIRNGEHIIQPLDIETLIKEHIQDSHQDVYEDICSQSLDSQEAIWQSFSTPRMVILQKGQSSSATFNLLSDKHLIIDWGDSSEPQILEGTEEQIAEHYYKGLGEHIITFYGDFAFSFLDFSDINGAYYALDKISADKFTSMLDIDDLNKLILTQ